ncbi:conserved hypothetical protein [Afipia carboxidovorans OM5]|nr:conserved hypothetical protein [Afipia carboxidovorans OM5]
MNPCSSGPQLSIKPSPGARAAPPSLEIYPLPVRWGTNEAEIRIPACHDDPA